jgi:DNA-binding NarL/FixJ family response regulator
MTTSWGGGVSRVEERRSTSPRPLKKRALDRERAALEVARASYDLASAHGAWLAGVLEAARPALDDGFGLVGVAYELDPNRGVRFSAEPVGVGDLLDGSIEDFRRMALSLSANHAAVSWGSPRALVSASTTFAREVATEGDRDWRRFSSWMIENDLEDALAAKAMDPSGAGVLLSAPIARRRSVSRREDSRWRRAMAHVLAGLRLRRALGAAEDEAIVDARGRLVHAQGDARNAASVLRTAAACVDRARSRRSDPDALLHAWRALVSGRWSLIDRFDSDGRRFLVARRNDPDVCAPPSLSPRERQVLAYAALGHSNKHIAYTLGLAPSTVSSHLCAAMKRLGVRRPSEIASAMGAVHT